MVKVDQNIEGSQKGTAKIKTERSASGAVSATRKSSKSKQSITQVVKASKAERLVDITGFPPLKEMNSITLVKIKQGLDNKITPLGKATMSSILVKTKRRPENTMTSLEKMELANNGISKNELEQLKHKAALNFDQLAEILSVSRATLINKKKNAVFNKELSEKIIAIAAIYSYGYEVFEDEARFNNWISKPNRALGYKTPYNLLSSSFGREEVEAIIGRIDYGVYS